MNSGVSIVVTKCQRHPYACNLSFRNHFIAIVMIVIIILVTLNHFIAIVMIVIIILVTLNHFIAIVMIVIIILVTLNSECTKNFLTQ